MAEKLYEPTLENASPWQKFLARMGVKIFLGYGIREEWTGEQSFYLFWCGRCKIFNVDYARGRPGYNERVICAKCQKVFYL